MSLAHKKDTHHEQGDPCTPRQTAGWTASQPKTPSLERAKLAGVSCKCLLHPFLTELSHGIFEHGSSSGHSLLRECTEARWDGAQGPDIRGILTVSSNQACQQTFCLWSGIVPCVLPGQFRQEPSRERDWWLSLTLSRNCGIFYVPRRKAS